MVNRVKEFLFSPLLVIAVRVSIGVVFIYAGAIKIYDPTGFAAMINNYDIIPLILVNIVAIVMPWIEVIFGVLLVLGVWFEGCSMLSLFLFCLFFVSITIAVMRGIDIDCGCFSTQAGTSPVTIFTIFRDMLLIAVGVYMVKVAHDKNLSQMKS